jgi:toxin ParE1/3/4
VKVLLTRTAYQRLEEIHSYIRRDSPVRADKWAQKLLARIEKFADAPRAGRKLPECDSDSLRETVFGNYRIIYRIKGGAIYVLTIRYFKQILPLSDSE